MEHKYHIPVMLDEVLEYLNLGQGKAIVDATIGTGGHSLKMLERIGPQGRLIGIDRDQESLDIAKNRLSDYSASCQFVYSSYSDIDKVMNALNIQKVDGMLFDLGISSIQLDDPDRGFTFQNEGPLDMRMDRNSYISAYDLVNNLDEKGLSELIWNFGQDRFHNRIARFLVRARQKHPISTTRELSNIILKAMPYGRRYQRIHPATRTFQAMRIAVNSELELLEAAISKAVEFLNKGARICVISFHSLEDRIVKLSFRELAANGVIKLITPKPLVPSNTEMRSNPSSRSAKFRVAERL
ncbi:MAG: 16S rRNA (cytosine(1402)-N(4))-methyltransferase RsmH [Candidatus Omnitrophota bacterium]